MQSHCHVSQMSQILLVHHLVLDSSFLFKCFHLKSLYNPVRHLKILKILKAVLHLSSSLSAQCNDACHYQSTYLIPERN